MFSGPDSLKEKIKANLNKAMRRQILSFNPKDKILSRDGIPNEELGDGTEASDVIDAVSWLEWHQVYGVMQTLIASHELRRNKVAVIPPYSEEKWQGLAQDTAEVMIWQKLDLKTKEDPPGSGNIYLDVPALPSRQGLSAQALAELDEIVLKRDVKDKEYKALAKTLIEENGLSDNFFSLYLETMIESPGFFGNPNKKELVVGDQLIIPFHQGNHYTVAVVHFVDGIDAGKDIIIAEIKYFDSFGSDLSPELRISLRGYFENVLKLKTTYNCVSSPVQSDGYNCGVFSCCAAMDIVNENFGLPERFLGDLKKGNYKTTMNCYRAVFAESLKKAGQNVKLSDKFVKDLNKIQKPFEDSSPYSHQISIFNSLMIDIIQVFESALAQVQGGPIVTTNMPVIPAEPLPNIDPMHFLKKLIWFYDMADRILQEKRQLENKTPKDKDDIELLQGVIQSFYGISTSIVLEAQQLSELMPRVVPPRPYVSFLSGYSWEFLLTASFVASLGLFIGFPLLLAGILKLGVMLPNNPILLMIIGGGLFFASSQLVPMLNQYFYPENESNGPDLPPSEQPAPRVDNPQQQPAPRVDNPQRQPQPAPRVDNPQPEQQQPAPQVNNAKPQEQENEGNTEGLKRNLFPK